MIEDAGTALLGRVVTSKAGRDHGDRYVVVATLGTDMVLVADGQRRTMDRPKKKNVKHLTLGDPVPALAEALARGERPGDEAIRMVLASAAQPMPESDAAGSAPEA